MHPDGRPFDTSEEAWNLQYDIIRRMSLYERSRLADQMSMAVRANIEAGVQRRFPDASEREGKIRAAALAYGSGVIAKAFR